MMAAITGTTTTAIAATTTIRPDLEFKRAILGLDAPDLTACYQCGTCSAVCPLSTSDNPFPRKEMAWVQWGLKERVLSNASIWSCHQCGLCSTYCPRDAKPANVMAALRDYSITHYAVPGFLGKWLESPRYLVPLFAVPTLILLAVLGVRGHLFSMPAGQIVFTKFIPDLFVEIFYSAMVALALLGATLGGLRYLHAMRRQAGKLITTAASNQEPRTGEFETDDVPKVAAGPPDLKRRLWPTLKAIFSHDEFRKCDSERVGVRRTYREHVFSSHLAVFYGFLGLVVTTTSVFVGTYAFKYLEPWPLWHPVKILGNVSGAALIAGLMVFLWLRIVDARRAGKNTYSDGLFLAVLSLTILTGYASEVTRLAGLRDVAYPTYFVHLVLIFFLLVYFPYSKFGHLVYHFVAMLYSSATSRASETALSASGRARV